ncbi:MAG: MOSC domain-containing protein [Sulfurovum sp.]|jgi:MOSC domain-containing protein YiiM|nr:MOSC domain-containing protein [Sulfurovum sp.]
MLSHSAGKVLKLYVSEHGSSVRMPKSRLSLDFNGVVGDKFYAKDIQRSVLITSVKSYDLALSQNISMPLGALGENILLDYNPYHLIPGQKLKMGKALLEISQNCTLCNHLSAIDKKLPKLLKKDRGIFVKVIQEGDIEEGDIVYLLE